LIGVLCFGLTLILEEKYKKEVKKMLKEYKLGVPQRNNTTSCIEICIDLKLAVKTKKTV
jgi:hypothetical protein